jgi:hypothetical protein
MSLYACILDIVVEDNKTHTEAAAKLAKTAFEEKDTIAYYWSRPQMGSADKGRAQVVMFFAKGDGIATHYGGIPTHPAFNDYVNSQKMVP